MLADSLVLTGLIHLWSVLGPKTQHTSTKPAKNAKMNKWIKIMGITEKVFFKVITSNL